MRDTVETDRAIRMVLAAELQKNLRHMPAGTKIELIAELGLSPSGRSPHLRAISLKEKGAPKLIPVARVLQLVLNSQEARKKAV
jgi:hypothetical protein